ncbi:MAG: 50S ribosomal protein L31 [bacterium]|nr:50S ribosomal protein L31 [bacterium]
MKSEIHPKYFPQAQIKCACGNVITVGSVKEKTEVEVCSACHPFFTGKAKLIDSAGRVERFKTRASLAESRRAAKRRK